MRNWRLLMLMVLMLQGRVVLAQSPETIEEYIAAYKDIAIAEMQRTGVPASIKLAQGIHETGAGTSPLVKKSNNHFGIKCKSGWTGPSVSHTDDAPNECFRKYEQPEQSYRDHSDFLRNSTRYASLFNLDPLDYEGWAKGLKKAGYATNPRYPQIIINLIQDYHLQDYTLIAMGKPLPTGQEVAVVLPETKKEEVLTAGQDPQPEQVVAPKPEYPIGEFKINGTRVVYVGEGVSMLAIANQYNIPLARLFEFNELEESETLEHGQLIFLQRKRRTGSQQFHVVMAGETLASIAQEEGIRLESLLEFNHLRADMQPATGEKLNLKGKASGLPRLSRSQSSASATGASGRR